MLQPRLFGCAFEMRFVFVALIISSALVSCQVINNEESIEATRIKREGVSENRDLTVLLVNDQQRNDYNSRVGRYHSVKPLIGLLTSTARTFIQDGVTTEFATQILGTTLNNGRIYAQLLTKSSLVLYNKPANEDAVAVKPTRVHSAFDGQWSVKQDLGFIDPDKFVLKNTDYLAPSSKMDIVYASKPAQESNFWNVSPTAQEQDNHIAEEPTGRRVQQNNEIPRFLQNEAFNYLDGPSVESEKKLDFVVKPAILENINALHRQSKAFEPVTEPIKIDSRIKEEINESNIVKVKPNYDLPTFTIKNEFSPIFYYIDNVESRSPPQPAGQQTKLPKKLFGQKSESRPKKTFTYAGFADFTTVVGDTVIIFTPNTDIARPQSPEEVNVFPSAKQVDKLNTKITFLAADIPVATATYKPYEVNAASKVTTSGNENVSEKVLYNDEDSLKKVHYEFDEKPAGVTVQSNSGFDFNLDVIQPSEALVPTTESTRLTDNLGVIPIQDSSKPTDPLTLLKPSATIIEEPKESVTTESDTNDDLMTSEEEADNTAAEELEKSEEDNEEEKEDEASTPANELGLITTTESGHSEESYEDVETTTETKHDTEQDVVCSSGLETQSTMTTAYKTLTYLTTYFIPLESKVTTTSVKSNVVVESNVGYLTNVVCKSDISIKPTAVVKVNVQSSVHSSLETPKVDTTQPEVVTKATPMTTPKQKDSSTTTEDKDEEIGTTVNNSSQEVEDNSEETETTTSTQTTTTERVTTSNSHVEVSVSTEHSTTPTEKPASEEEEEDSNENEIDLIYKTLYTTYTYFTTFFGDQASSVASHKSIVTNVITSTINLGMLDPSLLGAFDEDEIAPTSVGIGRPTESYSINSIIDLVKNKDVLESVEGGENYSSQTPTPSLGDDVASIKPDAVKTYFTTYTFFTTIYVGTDANVCSRSEVYTNYVGPDELIPTKSNPLGTEKTKAQFDFRNCKQIKREPPANPEENSSMESSVSMEENNEKPNNENKDALPQPTPVEVDMLFSVESNPLDTDTVTDVKSSSSRGERQYIENNNVLDDQISSESNIDEIMPSPTLLLQTSYTTFTYFTTMYIGKDSSKVKSRLETITNVVTETITPKKEPEEESNLPITYYTTFTYWTTLYKDKTTTITSREEIVSNVVTPVVQVAPTISPIDTTPIDVESVLPPKELEVEIKPSLIEDTPEQDDGKATFYTTYTYFTTFYAGNTSQIRSSLETVTNIVDNTKVVEDNQLGRKVPTGAVDKNLIQDNGEKPHISPTVVKEEIKPTQLPDISAAPPAVLVGTYIDNLFAEIKPADTNPPSDTDKKILFSQVAVISGDSVIVTNDNKTLSTESTTTKPLTNSSTTLGGIVISPTPEVIESSVAELDTTTEAHESEEEEEEDDGSSRKKSRLTFTTKKPSFTPVIIPFASRNRPTFSPKARVPSLSSATTITRADFTPTITATPTLKSVRPSGFGGNRKPSSFGGSSSAGKRFTGRSSISNPSANVPSASRSGGFGGRASIQPTSRRTGFRSSSIRANSLDFASRSAIPRIRPTASSRLRGNRNSASISLPPPEQDESETSGTQQEETATEALNEVTEATVRTTNNPLLRFRRPPVARQPGTAVTPRVTTPPTRRTAVTARGRLTTTTRRPSTRSTTNPLLSLRRQRPQNSLFPRRNLFKQPEPEPEEEIKENEQEVEESEEILEGEEFEEDNDYESSNRKEQQVAIPSTPAPKRNVVSIRPFSRRRVKRQVDYGNRKYTNFRRPGLKSVATKAPEPEPETETPVPVTQRARPGSRFNSRLNSGSRTTTSAPQKSSQRQPFIVRGESRTTSTSAPAYRRSSKSRASSRTTTLSSRPKAPKLLNSRSQSERSRSPSRSSTSRSRTRTTTSRASSRQRNSFENYSGERQNYKSIVDNGKITITHQIPTEVTIPVVNGKITEYKNVLTAKPSIEVLLRNQVATTLGPLGNQQLVLASESTKLAENGATEVIKFYLHETPTTTVIFTPTTIRGRKTSYSHVLPSTVYNVEPVTQTIGPEINANVPLANLLLSQLLLGNQQPAINPLLALQGQGLLPQQPVVQTPVTEYKTRTTTYVTTVTDARETVLPITFKGKAILTTIVDPTTNVITATEYVTDTIVSTPTALAPPPQLNSLLLPLLLQQQQQQQAITNPLLQTPNPLLGLGQPDLNLLQNNNLNNDIYSNSPKPNILEDFNSNEDFVDDVQDIEEDAPPPPPPARARNKPRTPKPAPPKLTSVVTMYVSGRYPGEFSTVLSTVVVDDTQTVRKREAVYYENIEVLPSILPSISQLASSESDSALENSIVSGTEKYLDDSTFKSQIETQSLESIVGSLSDHIRYDASPTYVVKIVKATAVKDLNLSSVDDVSSFNTNGIVFDNSPWRPGRDIDLVDQGNSEEERRFKNLATKILSNGVEVLVKDKNDGKLDQRKLKLMQVSSYKPPYHDSSPTKSLLSSAVATIFSRQQMSVMFPLHQLMQHNYIIKTCMTTYTYLTTVVQNKRSDVSTFETIVSVVTTESLTNLPIYATNIFADIKPTNTKYMEVKTIKPSSPSKIFQSNFAKIEKRIDNDNSNSFDLIQPSEVGHTSCTSSCSCSHTKTESLKTKYPNAHDASVPAKYGIKTSKYEATKLDLRPTNKETLDKKTKYNPYEYDNGSLAPTDKIVEKYTEVINDYSDEKDSNSVEESELLTNEQAPSLPNPSKPVTKSPEKQKPDKPQKPNKNKFVVADLLKLGSLGIKGLSQLAPVIEKMTGGFIKRQENRNITTTSKPETKLTAYSVNKRIDTDVDSKSNFPIYIPVDELETSESQIGFTNATLHQNLAWAVEHKQPKARIAPPKMIHESPLVNGGIPISPGEIITANSDVIVGRPAVGGPLTLAASGIKLQNPVNPPPLDSFVAADEQYLVHEKPPSFEPPPTNEHAVLSTKVDDSFDLRPPELPKPKPKPIRNPPRPSSPHYNFHNNNAHSISPPPKSVSRPSMSHNNDHGIKPEKVKPSSTVLGNHGRPAFLDYIPSLARPENESQDSDEEPDNSPSSSEIISTKVRVDDNYPLPDNNVLMSKPFLVDIQPSRVANVLIPHGSSTALVFAGSSEPHKTGDYVDDPLPYPEPGYFGSFSIDAPQMTNVHNVAPTSNKQFVVKPTHRPLEPYKPPHIYKNHTFKNDQKIKWKDTKPTFDYNKIPPPTSNQETFLQVGPHITAYNPNIYHPSNGNFEHYSHVRGKEKKKEIIDKEYENYLAVPPPPPKMHFNHENDKNKPYLQKPIVHTKPVQDMKVFLNIQHPVPKAPQKEQLPPKITSEIYFAAQVPSSKPTPVYTVHIPPAESSYGNSIQVPQNEHHRETHRDTLNGSGQIHGSVASNPSPTYANKSIANNEHNKDGTYTVTLNTATNVASNVGEVGQVVGSSVPVAIGTASKYGDLNTNIPISTNFAIRVEDEASPADNYNIQSNQNIPVVHEHIGSVINEYSDVLNKVSMGDNRWNTSLPAKNELAIKNEQHDYYNRQNAVKPGQNNVPNPSIAPSLNSHANFPMSNDFTTPFNDYTNVKPVTEYVDDIKANDQKRPAKLIPNIPTNSHGWYSSVPLNENTFNSITNIKVESTTRKIIPLLPDFNKDLPNFGQKITSVGKPPSDFWGQEKPSLTHHGRPFTKPNDYKVSFSSQPPITSKPYAPSYIPSNFGAIKQPAYDIPIRDNSDETTTVQFTRTTSTTTEKVKPVFETSEEIYDGQEESDNINSEIDGEVSQESMKVPIVSTSSVVENTSKSTTQITLLQDEVIPTQEAPRDKNVNLVGFNPGTQTEKPFGSYNKTSFSSNTIKPIYNRNPYVNARPFTANTITTLDHQLHQPHWQINEMLENSTNISYEENFDLNTGEEMSTVSTTKASTTHKVPYYMRNQDTKYKRPPRPVFSARPSNSSKDSNNIITSTVHIQDKKPLVIEKPSEKTTLPTFTITTDLDVNRTSSEIIDLSPPPPTIDYNFKPSTNDEMIMGMSPPPPRTPPAIRQPVKTTPRPIRTPPSYKTLPPRTLPPRTFPPRTTTQRTTRKPITRDDISTYRPSYDFNNVKRPAYNRDQPSLQLLPPPQEPSSVIRVNPEPTERPTPPSVIFPTLVSSGWLTSSGVEFASGYDFEPTSIQFPGTPVPTIIAPWHTSSTERSSNEDDSSENNDNVSSEKPVSEENNSDSSKEGTDHQTSVTFERPVSTESTGKESQENVSTERIRFGTTGYRNKTRRPYPPRDSTSRYKTTTKKPTSTTKPVKTRPEMLYPTRPTPIKKIPAIRPVPQRPVTINPSSVIESSESPVEDNFIKPTEVLKESSLPSIQELEASNLIERVPSSVLTSNADGSVVVRPTHHAGNEVKVFDEIIPTKTEFKTTVVTLTKTLSEPPQIVSSIGYVNLTHTLTVTHTKTSLVSQSEGAVTQTLILTNTHTSTIVDVVTEVYTQVQPTTIIETVTKHIPIPLDPTPVLETTTKTKLALDDVTISSEESDNYIIKDSETTENIQKIHAETDNENDTFLIVMNKSQNGGQAPPVQTDIDTGDYDGITRNEQVNSNGVSQVLFGEILLAGTPYLETTNVGHTGAGYGKECQPDCKASRNERCQRIDGLMKCVCRPGFARMFPDRPCKPTYTYSVKLALGTQGDERLQFHESLADNSSKQYQALATATHEGINRMVMQSDLRDVFHGVHITGFHPVEMRSNGELFQGVMNDFYVQLSDNAHESRLKEVLEKYLRHNNYSLGGTDVHAAGEMVDKLEVNDFDECVSGQFHDCSEHSQCFNLRGTYTCSCLEGFADLSVNSQYPGRICSAEPVGCERCNYHGACYSRDDRRVLCECFQWYAGSTCHINLKVVLISLVVVGALLTAVLAACAVLACSRRPRPPPRSIVACIQSMPGLHQGAMPSKHRADRRALISERGADSGDASSVQNASLPYMPAKRPSKKTAMSEPPAHEPPPPPAPAVMIPRARLHPHHSDSRENVARKKSLELSSEAKLISYLESGAVNNSNTNDEMRRKHSMESSYSAMKERHNKQGALVSAGFKVSTTIRPDEQVKDDRDDMSSVHKDMDDLRFDSLRKSYSQEDISEWTDAERRLGELTLSEARSVGGTLPASTGRAASSTRLTHQEANTMAERDLGSTFLLPHVHLYKPDLTSDVSEFDSL